MGMLQKFNQQGVVAPTVAPSTAPAFAELPENEYVSGAQVRQYLQQIQQTQLSPQLHQLAQQSSQGVLAFVQQKYQDDFNRWGPEIQSTIAQLPLEQRSLDNLERVVKFVRSEHLQELLADKERELRQQFNAETGSPGLRSTGAPGAGPVPTTQQQFSLANDKLPPEFRERAARAGLSDQQVADFARANGMTVEEFYTKNLLAGTTMTDKAVIRG